MLRFAPPAPAEPVCRWPSSYVRRIAGGHVSLCPPIAHYPGRVPAHEYQSAQIAPERVASLLRKVGLALSSLRRPFLTGRANRDSGRVARETAVSTRRARGPPASRRARFPGRSADVLRLRAVETEGGQ